MKRILVGCPVMEAYESCIERWLRTIGSFGYPVDTMLVDTGEGAEFFERWSGVTDMIHLGLGRETPYRRVALGMEFLRQYALTYKYDYLLCVEIDVIAPPETPIVMRKLCGVGFDYVAHTYPPRNGLGAMIGFGCTIFRSEFLKQIRFDDGSPYVYPDTWLWEFVVSRSTEFKTCKVHGVLNIDHRNCSIEDTRR